MSDSKDLVLDANILVRGVLGDAVSSLLEQYQDSIDFYIPDISLADAHKHIPGLAAALHVDDVKLQTKLNRLEDLLRIVDHRDFRRYELPAAARIRSRDISDWPIVATSLLLDAPLWTEDRDFFGCGIATWTTNNVGIYLRDE